jgi:hypothetical protein
MPKVRRLEELLAEIKDALRDLNRRMDKLEHRSPPDVAISWHAQHAPVFVPGALASLPEHLRRSMEVATLMGQATAEAVAMKTGRSRAAESDYLNQLVDRGFLKKERVGKEIVFQVFNLHTICPMCGHRVLITAKFCSMCGASLLREERILAGHGNKSV